MTRRYLLKFGAIACGTLAATSLPGCQYFYEFEVRGTIKDCADGSPLAGVRITARGFDLASPRIADTGGAFTIQFDVSDGDFPAMRTPRWSLILTKDGYADEVIDISPREEPKSNAAPTLIVVAAHMRAQHSSR